MGFLGGAERFIAKPCLKQQVMRFPTIRYGCSAQCGVDKTYAIITNHGQRGTLNFDADDSSISYDIADIVYSAVKRNGRIIESFTETSNN